MPFSQARLNNVERDLGLEGTDFNVAVSVLNIGYVDSAIPLQPNPGRREQIHACPATLEHDPHPRAAEYLSAVLCDAVVLRLSRHGWGKQLPWLNRRSILPWNCGSSLFSWSRVPTPIH